MPRKPSILVPVRGELRRIKCNILHQLHIDRPSDADYGRYELSARAYRKLQTVAIAESVGNGVCGVASNAELAVTATAFALSKYYLDRFAETKDTKDLDAALKLEAVRSRTLRSAFEYAGGEAAARAKRKAAKTVVGIVEPDPLAE